MTLYADPVKDFQITDKEVVDAYNKIAKYKEIIKEKSKEIELIISSKIDSLSKNISSITSNKKSDKSDKDKLPNQELKTVSDIEGIFKKKEEIRKKLTKKIDELIRLKETVLNEELEKMKKVMVHFDLCNEETVKAKGQVACFISSTDEIMLTEMLYHGQLNDIEPNYLAALLSCFLVDERDNKDQKLDFKVPQLKPLYERVNKCADRVSDVLIEKRLDTDKDKYMNSFKADMMEAALSWANGEKFVEVCKKCEYYEGNIIRCIRRLDELIKEVGECAHFIGNNNLKERLDKASELIKRGIVFAASLYLSNEK